MAGARHRWSWDGGAYRELSVCVGKLRKGGRKKLGREAEDIACQFVYMTKDNNKGSPDMVGDSGAQSTSLASLQKIPSSCLIDTC